MDQLHLSTGLFFEKNKPPMKINAFNFAINERCYDILNAHTFYDPGMVDDPTYQWTNGSINADTAFGMPNVH
jgi:hypothetical protein